MKRLLKSLKKENGQHVEKINLEGALRNLYADEDRDGYTTDVAVEEIAFLLLSTEKLQYLNIDKNN